MILHRRCLSVRRLSNLVDHHTNHQAEDHNGGQAANRRSLVIALGITSIVLVVEVIGGLLTGSLALLADAGHMGTDVAALGLSLFATWLAERPATPERPFGFYRAEVLAALFNAATLIAVAFYIFWESISRIGDPPHVESGPMLVVAITGLVANGASALVLSRGGGHTDNLNTRGAYLHVIGDLLGSVAAIAAAVVMLLTGWYLADPLLSAAIGLLILWSSWQLLRDSTNVLLEGTPKEIEPMRVRTVLRGVDGVVGVHDLHIWTVTSGLIALSAHVEVAGYRPWAELLSELSDLLNDEFGIAHVTLQPEPHVADLDPRSVCSLDTPEGRAACRSAVAGRRRIGTGHRHAH